MAEETETAQKAPITIKKYANRRLYNTATSSYVTLDYLAEMIKEGVDFVVYDAKTGDDITRSVLTHIIVEQEGKGGQNLLPVNFLRHLISFYGDSLETVVPKYLDHSMQSFAQHQGEMRDYMKDTFGGMTPFSSFEEMGKQNAAMFESAMKMFTPFTPEAGAAQPQTSTQAAPKPAEEASSGDDLNALRDQMKEMQKRLDGLDK